MNSNASPAICWATSRSANPLMSRHITLFALWLLPLWACAGNDANGPRYLIEQGASANVLQVRLTMQGKPPFTLLPARQLPGSSTPVSPALVCLANNQPVALNQPFSCKAVGWQLPTAAGCQPTAADPAVWSGHSARHQAGSAAGAEP